MGHVRGMCYPASEALYHLLGGREAGLTPMRIVHEGVPHWYLRWVTDGFVMYLDPTSTQFKTPVPYDEGRGCGFLTKEPSARAQALLTGIAETKVLDQSLPKSHDTRGGTC